MKSYEILISKVVNYSQMNLPGFSRCVHGIHFIMLIVKYKTKGNAYHRYRQVNKV